MEPQKTFSTIMPKIIELAKKQLANQQIANIDKPVNPDNIVSKSAAQEILSKLNSLIQDIKAVKRSEDNSNKLRVLTDSEKYVSFIHWRITQKLNPSLMTTVAFIFWYKAPRALIDNRSIKELANDIIKQAELISQNEFKTDNNNQFKQI